MFVYVISNENVCIIISNENVCLMISNENVCKRYLKWKRLYTLSQMKTFVYIISNEKVCIRYLKWKRLFTLSHMKTFAYFWRASTVWKNWYWKGLLISQCTYFNTVKKLRGVAIGRRLALRCWSLMIKNYCRTFVLFSLLDSSLQKRTNNMVF